MSPFRLLDFQAHALAVGVWADTTWSGAELDTVIPLPEGSSGVPTTSELLAAWLATANTPGGSYSRALMAGQDLNDPSTLRFPAIALVVFVSDVATDGGTLAPPTTPSSPSPSTTAAGALMSAVGMRPATKARIQPAVAVNTICSDTSAWIQGMIDGLFDALRVATPAGGVGHVLASAWNWLVSAARFAVKGLLTTLTDAALGTIRSIAATIASVAEQVASILPYAVKVRSVSESGGTVFRLASAPLRGTFQAAVTAGDLPDWPAVLADCAATAQVALPDFHAKDVAVSWGPLESAGDPLLGPTDQATGTSLTDASGQAMWPFLTSRDPGEAPGDERDQVDWMPVAVHRPEIDAARRQLTDALLAPIPSLLRPFVTPLFAPVLDGLQSRLNAVLDARGRGPAFLVYHDQPPATPAPPPSAAPSGSCDLGTIAAGHYRGTFHETVVTTLGGISSVDTHDITGPVDLTVAPGGAVSGTFSYVDQEHQIIDVGHTHDVHESTAEMTGGTARGSACDLELAFGHVVLTKCHDQVLGDCLGGSGSQFSLVLPLGSPARSDAGHLVWTQRHDDKQETGDDVQSTLEVAVDGPA
ncbi:MAG TPA: hypothetical protein VH440_11640 [Candidatus Limnocylindrales bacterium]